MLSHRYNRAFGDYFHAFDDEPRAGGALAWVLEPFAALDMITGGEADEGWDFDEEPLSCYTYVSVVGGGYLVATITAFVQITLPITLFYGVIHQEILENFESVPVCEGDGSPNNRFAILCVVLMYITTIVPSQIELFMNKVANADNAISKLNSLRQVITDKNEDTYGQKWGFKLDIFCNTATPASVHHVISSCSSRPTRSTSC